MDAPTPIPISSLEHYEYCPRQCALILVDGLWSENRHTVRGQRFHRRVDSGEITEARGAMTIRTVQVWSDRLGLVGRCDAVEVQGGQVVPVEYKGGTRHGLAADVQLCAQALCLEEMLGISIDEGAIWYGRHRRRESVPIQGELRARTIRAIEQVHGLRAVSRLPLAVDDERCAECQLMPVCVPDKTSPTSRPASEYVEAIFAVSGDGGGS